MVILTLVGPRPQIIKEAALQMYLNTTPDIQEILVHSGQHYDYNMSDVFLEHWTTRMCVIYKKEVIKCILT